MGLALPKPRAPRLPRFDSKRSGNLLFVSGQVPGLTARFLGLAKSAGVFAGAGTAAARDSALMVLACIKEAVGDLDNVREIVRIKGYMNVDPDFTDVSACLNGASELFIELFGDSGRHSRTAIGAASMPFGVAIEVEGVFEVE